MNQQWKGFQSIISIHIERFIAYKRALGRRYDVEEKTLRLLDRTLVEEGVKQLCDVTPALIEKFLTSRPRVRPRSYNHLLCTLRRLFDWMVTQEVLEQSPVYARAKRRISQRAPFIFDIHSAKRLLDVARRLPERSTAPMRGETYYAIFAILFGLGLRVGEVCRLKIEDIDFNRKLLVIKETKFYMLIAINIRPFGCQANPPTQLPV